MWISSLHFIVNPLGSFVKAIRSSHMGHVSRSRQQHDRNTFPARIAGGVRADCLIIIQAAYRRRAVASAHRASAKAVISAAVVPLPGETRNA